MKIEKRNKLITIDSIEDERLKQEIYQLLASDNLTSSAIIDSRGNIDIVDNRLKNFLEPEKLLKSLLFGTFGYFESSFGPIIIYCIEVIPPYEIKNVIPITDTLKIYEVSAYDIAKSYKPGQFIIVRSYPAGNRINASVVSADPRTANLTFIVKDEEFAKKHTVGSEIMDIIGPVGNEMEMIEYGNVLLVGTFVSSFELAPIAKALKKNNNSVNLITLDGNTQYSDEAIKYHAELFSDVIDDHISFSSNGYYNELKNFIKSSPIDLIITSSPYAIAVRIEDLAKSYNIPYKPLTQIMPNRVIIANVDSHPVIDIYFDAVKRHSPQYRLLNKLKNYYSPIYLYTIFSENVIVESQLKFHQQERISFYLDNAMKAGTTNSRFEFAVEEFNTYFNCRTIIKLEIDPNMQLDV